MADAVILAGAVAKGAFEAGALSVLLRHRANGRGVDVRRVVAASSGALNGVYLAAAIRRGAIADVGADLRALWLEHAVASDVFDVSPRDLMAFEGVSTNEKLLALLRTHIRPEPGHGDVELRVVTTPVAGRLREDDHPAATTFEHVAQFDGPAFDCPVRLNEIFEAVAASAAFPVVFRPSPMTIEGARVPCFDGGLCNNAPIKHAISDPSVSRVFVISPNPRIIHPTPQDRSGLGLLAHLVDILVHERLYRDIREARTVNRGLAELEENVTSPTLRELIQEAIGWKGRRRIEIIEIRPPSPLEGNAFAGLFSRRLREAYLDAGELAARNALASPE